MKLGELMVRQGLLTEDQVQQVLAAQARRTEPFGSICERLFGIAPEVVEGAWVEQYEVLTAGLEPAVDLSVEQQLGAAARGGSQPLPSRPGRGVRPQPHK